MNIYEINKIDNILKGDSYQALDCDQEALDFICELFEEYTSLERSHILYQSLFCDDMVDFFNDIYIDYKVKKSFYSEVEEVKVSYNERYLSSYLSKDSIELLKELVREINKKIKGTYYAVDSDLIEELEQEKENFEPKNYGIRIIKDIELHAS